jgi:hypothetical protein
MSVEKSSVPPELRKALELGLKDFVAVDSPAYALLMHPTQGRYLEQQVFTLGLKELDAGQGLEHAEPGGWRFMGWNGLDLAVAADVDVLSPVGDAAPPAEPPDLGSLWLGEPVLAAWKAIERAEQSLPTSVQNQKFESVQLWIPGLLIEALWFREKKQPPESGWVAGSSWVIPYRHQIQTLDPITWYPEMEFLHIVKPLASERLKFNDALPPNQRRGAVHPGN